LQIGHTVNLPVMMLRRRASFRPGWFQWAALTVALCSYAREARARCGDGALESVEGCDDANTRAGDGCSASCTIETGFTCTTQTPIPLDNGDFERPGVQRFNAVDDYLPGWTIAPTTQVDYIARTTEWTCADGSVGCIDLAGTPSRGVIYRDVPTTPGTAYTVHFRMAANCTAACTREGYLSVADGAGPPYASSLYVATVPINNTLRTDYELARFSFTARSTSTRLTFSGTELSLAGMFIDDVVFPASVCVSTRCGNGVLDAGEVCDDGNTRNSDGCSAICQLERRYLCPTPGAACRPICGDAVVVGTEPCDDGNLAGDDGCSTTCAIEPGFQCGVADPLDPRSVCRRPPVLVAPADGASMADRRPVIRGTATSGTTLTVVVDGVALGPTTADSRGDWSLTPTDDLANGMHSASAGERVGLFVAQSRTHTFTVGVTAVDAGTDVGTDATVADAAVVDATVADATVVDAAVVDAAVIDATVVDATVVDATVVDATVVDAAVVDAAVVDAAVVDARSSDVTDLDVGPTDASRGDAAADRVAVLDDAPSADAGQSDAARDDVMARNDGATPDAAAVDAGTPDAAGSGCGCRAAGAAPRNHGLALLALLALLARRRRRAAPANQGHPRAVAG